MEDWHIGAILIGIIAVVIGFLAFTPSMWNIMGRADISEVMGLYEYIFEDAADTCEDLGGVWHADSDFWGCEGVGPDVCTGELADMAKRQCEGMGAKWVCNSDNVYCRYQMW